MIIDGSAIAEKILSELKQRATPASEFAAILVGEDPASISFLKQKAKTAELLGVRFKLHQFPDTIEQSQLEHEVRKISHREEVGGVIVQLPLPKKFDRVRVLNAIGIEKDVDVLNGETTQVLAPAAGALVRVLQEIGFDPKGKNAVVVGSGLLIGRPVVTWLMDKTKSLTVVNKGGYQSDIVKGAELIVTGAGVPNLVKGEHVGQDAVVIDFGYGRENGVLTGDVEFESVKSVAGHVTPTPGGMGPIVVAQLFANFYQLAK